MEELIINSIPLSSYGGELIRSYTVGGTPVTNEIYQGVNRTSWTLLKSMFGLRSLTLTIVFSGSDLHDAKTKRSLFNIAAWGRSELFFPEENYYYSVICRSMGDEELIGTGDGSAKIKSEYAFEGIRHGQLLAATVPVGGSLNNPGTMPFSDCVLTATVGTSAATYSLGGATFSSVTAGQVLVFDGINKKITNNGVNCAATTAWEHFPALTPGLNTIAAVDPVTVEWYPCYI